jgi:hypothetical protein
MRCLELEQIFPNLIGSGYDRYPVSGRTLKRKWYNCIAYAMGDTTQPWWPHPNRFAFFWPPHLPRELPNQETLDNFVRAFEWGGYVKCNDGNPVTGIEKVVIFLKDSLPTHAARQLESGVWTSKCGHLEDIQHESLTNLEGSTYGKAVQFMQRPRDRQPLPQARSARF